MQQDLLMASRSAESANVRMVERGTHGSLNVPIEHHPTIRYMVYNGYYKVMSNIPKMGQLPTPGTSSLMGVSLQMQLLTGCFDYLNTVPIYLLLQQIPTQNPICRKLTGCKLGDPEKKRFWCGYTSV